MAVKEIKDIDVVTIGEIAKISESKTNKSAPKQKSKSEPKVKAKTARDPEDILAEALFGDSSMAKEVAEELKTQGKNMKDTKSDKAKTETKPFAVIKRLIKKGDTDFRTGVTLTRGRVDLKLESGEVISLTLKEYDSLFDSDKKNRVCRFKPGRSIEDLNKVRSEHDRFEKLEFERKLFESFNSEDPVANVRAAFMTHNAEFRISRDQLLLRLADLGYQLRK